MRISVAAKRISRLSTGRHFLAFLAEPARVVHLDSRSVLAVVSVTKAEGDLEAAEARFVRSLRDSGTDTQVAAERFHDSVTALLDCGVLHRENA
ncbi:hypothetical protein SAMN05421504_101204 [Amycolatopsis xylanica]|uniref:Uncharacterized protein n=1 Tax=Amycolatopsis xylanica TaxID=589385 RepID=A0A1H2SF24_9PSEU|nr:hypothetical protein [Amycolatopsis xylanica]SDW30293.1 hypothetical protein SAMN05421504_101204 [Amycolatopsis xylanica]